MEEKQHLICINCPMGCHLTITELEGGGWFVEGNECKRGEAYAVKEVMSPTRVLTTTVKIIEGIHKRLPVRTNEAILKSLLFEAMHIIDSIVVEAPVQMGDIIISNLLDTGVNVIASRSMSSRSHQKSNNGGEV